MRRATAAAMVAAAVAPTRSMEATMFDLGLLALGLVFFASAIGYVLLCERL